MSVQLKRRRDTAANVATYTGAQGELIVDLTNNRVTVHDGVTPGGWAAAKLSDVTGVSSARSVVSDANYIVLTTDRSVAIIALTAARTLTLPASSAFSAGIPLYIFDESGSASSSLAVSIAASGTDTIDGASSVAINSAYGFFILQSNGAGKWTVMSRGPSNLPAVGIGTAADPSNPLSVYGASALFNGPSFNFTVNKSSAASTASILFQDGFSGRAQVGLCGDDNFHFKVSATGAAWFEALDLNATTGQASFPQGIASGEAIGFRNRLRNATFAISQRAVSGTVTLAAGAYGHDGLRAGSAGASYTFAASGIDTTISIASGSLIMPVESVLIEGGVYTLSNAGTATARIWQGPGYTGSGSYVSGAQTTGSLTAATQTNIEFNSGGTILRPQFEPGTVATAFERRPLCIEQTLCQRYFVASAQAYTAIGAVASGYGINAYLPVSFPAAMRAAPTVTYVVSGSPIGCAAEGVTSIGLDGFAFYATSTGTGPYFLAAFSSYTASAEI